MNPISAFLVSHMIAVYFAYGLAFFVLGIGLSLSRRHTSAFRLAGALMPLALFGFLHAAHEWVEMFQLIGAPGGYVPPLWHEAARVLLLGASFALLLVFALLLLVDRPNSRTRALAIVAAFLALWIAATALSARYYHADAQGAIALADVFSRYTVGVPAALLATWALMSQQRSFRDSNMPEFGANLVWCAAAVLLYGLVGQLFVRPTPLPTSPLLTSASFLAWFGIPVQLFRASMAVALTFFMLRVLGVFEAEERTRLQESNEARLVAQAATLAAVQESSRQLEAVNRELQLATQKLSLLVDLSNTLHGSAAWPEPLTKALQHIVDTLAFATAGLILLPSPDEAHVHIAAEVGYQGTPAGRQPHANSGIPEPAAFERARAEASALGAACIAKGLLHCSHVDGTVLLMTLEEALRAQPCLLNMSPVLQFALPLRSGDRTIGSLVLTSDPNDPGQLAPADLSTIVGVAQELGLSVENALLHSQAHARERTLAELLGQVVNAQEGERQRIARELHDATGQSLTAIGLGLSAVRTRLEALAARDGVSALLNQIDEVLSYSNSAMRELHAIIADLRPPHLDELGLEAAIQWYAEDFEKRWGIRVRFSAGGEPRALSTEYSTVLFRLVQEALRNVARHADAARVDVALLYGEHNVHLFVRDDGHGFATPLDDTPGEGQTGWGLVGMKERVSLVGGSLYVTSARGAGVTIEVRIPLATVQTPVRA